jgi:hypothetical protein
VPCLHVLDADGNSVAMRHLRSAGLTIGSGADNDIVLDADDVSPAHLRVDFDGRKVTVTDLGSHGTLLEGHRLLPQVTQEWGREQWLQVGTRWLWVQQPSAPAPVKVIEVLLDQSSRRLTITPGKAASCHVTLVNQTVQVDHVTLSIDGIPEEWIEGGKKETWLQPNAKKEVTLTVNVPKTPAGRAGDYHVTIQVHSITNPEIEQGSATAHWTVLRFDAMSASITPARAGAMRQAGYTLTLQNSGNAPADCVITGSDDEKHLEYLFTGGGINDVNRLPMTVEPGGNPGVKLKVVAPRLWFGGATTRPFTVQTVADEGPKIATEAQFTHRPILPYWALAAVPVVLLAVIFFGTRYMRPVVRTIYVAPRAPLPGERVEIMWDAPKATRVRLLVNELAVQPDPDVGEGKYVFSEGFDKDARIRIIGSNVFGEASRDVTVTIKPPPPKPAAAPATVEMSVSPPNVAAGQAVTIAWRVMGGNRADFSLTGSVPLQGTYIDRPDADRSYTITAYNAENVATTRTIPVKVTMPGTTFDPRELVLAIYSPRPKDNRPLTIGVGDSVTFQWAAKNAQSIRIDTVTPLKLEGSTGQRTVQLKGEGRYSFTLVATNEKNQEFRSEQIEVMADCKFSRFFRLNIPCSKTPEVEWK